MIRHLPFLVFVWCSVFLMGCLFPAEKAASEEAQPVKIGVLAYRGKDTAIAMWTPTAHYLNRAIPAHTFAIVPLNFDEINPAVASGGIDFVIANPSIYVELEERFSTTRIATMKNRGLDGGSATTFGGVIFRRAEAKDNADLASLRGKSFAAVDETSLGGWQVAWRELKKNGIDPYRDFSSLRFLDTHDAVVYAVRDGKAEAGTVRTDTLERMAEEGKIDLGQFQVVNPQHASEFPYLLSTMLYPEWPLAKVRHTENGLAEQVVAALLGMPHDGPAAKAAKVIGWTVPGNYQPVRELMRELRLGPYRDYGKITLAAALRQYWHLVALTLAAALILAGATITLITMNRRLTHTQGLLREERNGLEHRVKERTAELSTANEDLRREVAERTRAEEEQERLIADLQKAMAEIKTLQGILPICSFCKKIRDDSGAWHQLESYISQHSEVMFSHGMCKECAKKYYPDYNLSSATT